MTFALGQHSIDKLVGVHPDLVAVVKLANTISKVDFSVVQGLRSASDEADMVKKHASTTMHSRHLAGKSGFACAVDCAAFVNGQIAWEPLALYAQINDAMQAAAKALRVPVAWGGAWAKFKDFDHWELSWSAYP